MSILGEQSTQSSRYLCHQNGLCIYFERKPREQGGLLFNIDDLCTHCVHSAAFDTLLGHSFYLWGYVTLFSKVSKNQQ